MMLLLLLVLEEIKEDIVVAFGALGALLGQHHIHEAPRTSHQHHGSCYYLFFHSPLPPQARILHRYVRRRPRPRQRRRRWRWQPVQVHSQLDLRLATSRPLAHRPLQSHAKKKKQTKTKTNEHEFIREGYAV